jgi:uncharacterized membrane protein
MAPDMTAEPTSNVPYLTGRTVLSAAAPEPGPGRVPRQTRGPATLLVVLLGVGALWVWSRPRPPHTAKRRPNMPTLAGGRGLHIERTVTVQRSPDELYRAWRDLESLPRLLPGYLMSVTPVGPGRTRWVVAGPDGLRASWEAELTADEQGRLIAWRSAPASSVDIAGSVRFDVAPGGRGTEITVLTYAPPGGKIGAAAAALTGGGGDRLVREALRRFKQLVETGEIADGSMRHEGQDTSAAADRAVRSA